MRDLILIVEETKARRGQFDGWVEGYGKVVSSGHTPFLTAARRLLKLGVDPQTVLTMQHKKTGTDSLRGQIGEAAKLSVSDADGPPRFVRFVEPPGVRVPKTDEKQISDRRPGPVSVGPSIHAPGATGPIVQNAPMATPSQPPRHCQKGSRPPRIRLGRSPS